MPDDVEALWRTKDWLGCHCSRFVPELGLRAGLDLESGLKKWVGVSLFTLCPGTGSKGGFRLGIGAQKWVGVQEIHCSHW